MDNVYTELKKFGRVKLNELLSKHTTFKVGGPADYFIVVEEREKLIAVLNYLSGEGINFFVLGDGSNLLFADDGYRGVVIKLQNFSAQVGKIEDGLIEVEAGVKLAGLLNLAVKEGVTGLEWAAGIPGTVGAAIRGNAGAYGQDTSTNVVKVEVWLDGEVMELSKEECGFAYRESVFKHNSAVVLRGWFRLEKGNHQEIVSLMQKNILARTGKFPLYPSAGCFFKNAEIKKIPAEIVDKIDIPEKYLTVGKIPAGWLIEQSGAGGMSVGGAEVALSHCNFIVNKDQATQADILNLVDEIKAKVYTKFGIELETEVQVVYS